MEVYKARPEIVSKGLYEGKVKCLSGKECGTFVGKGPNIGKARLFHKHDVCFR